ncbi:MFS transporter [Nocardioides sp. KR10-350]|uniref:MFS transporter n=1 Tax=Nocardioides cheoyonin TaxID=3156615 RepID=UPI0032B3A347
MSSPFLSRARNQTDRRRADLPTDLPPNAGRAAMGIAIVLVAQLMLILDAMVVTVALPRIAVDLSFGPAALSWVLNGYTLAFGGLLLLGGRIGDVFGRRRTFAVGLAVFTLFSLAGGLAPTAGLLVAARALQGVGAALAAPQVLALLTTSAPDEAARNRALALFSAVTSGGATVGLILGGILTDAGSWRWTLFINVPIGLAVLALVGRYVDETARRPGRFDVVGAVTATGGAVAVVWALIGAPDHGWGSARTVGGLVVGALLIGAFVLTERRVAHPLLRLALFRSHRRVAALALIPAIVGAQFSMFFLLTQYVEIQLGYGPLTTGVAFLPLTIGIFAMSRLTPRLLSRFGAPPLMVVGSVGAILSFVWLSELGSTSSYAAAILGPMLLNGLSAGLVFMPSTALVLGGVEPEHAGAASGLLQTMQQLGGAVGLAVIASVYAANAVPDRFMPGVHQAFLAAAVLAGLALVSALTLVVRRPSYAAAPAAAPEAD